MLELKPLALGGSVADLINSINVVTANISRGVESVMDSDNFTSRKRELHAQDNSVELARPRYKNPKLKKERKRERE